MYRTLLVGTALVALAAPLAAQTVIDSNRTTPVRTSELANGQGDALKIAAAGAITLTAGNAVTVDSDHDVTNEGKITITNANGANGILVTGPRTADIVNSGTITVDETYAGTDSDNDGDLDGPFAVGGNRAGIRVDGALTGDITHTGTIIVKGNDSYGIVIDGPLTGDLVHNGKTTVIGDRGTGVSAQDITGDVRLAGTVTVVGEGSVGAHFGGDIDGALVVQGDISSTGYRYTTPPANVAGLDADDLLQGGSALVIEGDVSKGIIFAVAPADSKPDDNDEDKDGIEDSKEGNAKITSYGEAPAVIIGDTDSDITIGATEGTGTGFGIIMNGSILGDGVYSGIAGNGMVIGGQGGAVAIENGMLVTGTIAAKAKNADTTALRIGAGTDLPELRNSGTITATSTGTAGGNATAVIVEAGANMPKLSNSGTITATTGTKDGAAIAILDESGTLDLVENSGKIIATGAADGTGPTVAIDLSANGTGATIKQTAVAAGIAPPSIEGDIRFGAGADLLDVADGTVKGKVTFGDGVDRFVLSGDAIYNGAANFGGQADNLTLAGGSRFNGSADFEGGAGVLTIADQGYFNGKLHNSQNLAVTVSGGTLDLRGATTINSLDVGSTGVVVATLNPTAGEGTAITVNGTASFVAGSKIKLRITDIANAVGSYDVLTAGTLVGGDKLAADSALVPFMYKAALAVAGNVVSVDIDRKATSELGLNRSESTAFDALYDALAKDDEVADVFLGIGDGAVFQAYVAQTLPDHAGGAFEGISQGLRTFDRHMLDPQGPLDEEGKLRIIADFAGWDSKKKRGDSASYKLDGLGFRGGVEYLTGIGAFGVTGSWLWSEHKTGYENDVTGNSYEGGVHWRGRFGAIGGFARAGFGTSDFDGSRYFAAGTGDDKIEKLIDRDWSGDFITLTGGVSAEGGSQFFFFRPSVVIDYLRLKEDGYTESGGGDALNLTVEDRTSDELGLNLGMAVGADLYGMRARDDIWMRIETEGGWRQKLAGDLGDTTARYGDGDDFTLTSQQRGSGWFARLKGYGGDSFYTVGGEIGAEEQFGEVGYTMRASLRFGW